MIQPDVPIFCNGQKTYAYFDAIRLIWKCHRCGAKVKVTW
jgi:PHP family Zn ribbon phosphoesterase